MRANHGLSELAEHLPANGISAINAGSPCHLNQAGSYRTANHRLGKTVSPAVLDQAYRRCTDGGFCVQSAFDPETGAEPVVALVIAVAKVEQVASGVLYARPIIGFAWGYGVCPHRDHADIALDLPLRTIEHDFHPVLPIKQRHIEKLVATVTPTLEIADQLVVAVKLCIPTIRQFAAEAGAIKVIGS